MLVDEIIQNLGWNGNSQIFVPYSITGVSSFDNQSWIHHPYHSQQAMHVVLELGMSHSIHNPHSIWFGGDM